MPVVTTAVLKSRIPEIMAELEGKVTEAVHASLEDYARELVARAPVAEEDETAGDLKRSIHADHKGVWGAWYWFFSEYGTIYQEARPWARPAIQAGMSAMFLRIIASLKEL